MTVSMEMYAFVPAETVPDRGTWQAALDATGLGVVLDADFDPLTASGFCPMTLGGRTSGCEIDHGVDELTELQEMFPELTEAGLAGRKIVSFRWGGDMAEFVCALAATATLMSTTGASVYEPTEGVLLTAPDGLLDDAKSVLPTI